MYRDVKKKLLSVALCICMIIGMVQVVPKAKAAASVSGNTITVKGKDSDGVEQEYKFIVDQTSFSYNGGIQMPTIRSATVNGSNLSISGWTLERKSGDDGKTVGTHTCYLKAEGYTFTEAATSFDYTITQAVIDDIIVDKDSAAVAWRAGGTSPQITSVNVETSGGDTIPLNPTQYTVSSALGTGSMDAELTVTDSKNFDLTPPNKSKTTFSYKVAYSLEGKLADNTTEQEMYISNTTKPYTGNVQVPEIYIKKSPTETQEVTGEANFIVKYYKNGTPVDQIINAGTYTVKVSAKNDYALVNGNYFKGTFTGTFTVEAGMTTGLKVVAADEKQNDASVTVYEGGEQKRTLIYKYQNGSAVKLRNVYVYDGIEDVTDCFTPLYTPVDPVVGSALLTLQPKEDSNYSGNIQISYFITSMLSIKALTFEGKDPGDYTNLVYTGEPIAPIKVHVVNQNGGTVNSGYTVTYKYVENGVELTATGADDPHLATPGEKKVVVTGTGNYQDAGSVEQSYTVLAVNMESEQYKKDFTLTLSLPKTGDTYYAYYKGSAWEPETTLIYKKGTANEKTLVAGSDYTVTYANNTMIGSAASATVTAMPGSNYAGSRTVQFSIYPLDLQKAKVVGDDVDNQIVYTGRPIKPEIKLLETDKYEYTLQNGDYDELQYAVKGGENLETAPTDVGEYQITIKNKNTNISGDTITLDYKIVPKNVLDLGFQLLGVNDDKIEWNGSKTDPKVSCGNMVEGDDKDFTTSYAEDDHPSTVDKEASVTITGVNNYTGTKTITYTITPRVLNQDDTAFSFDTEVSGAVPSPGYTIDLAVTDANRKVTEKALSEGTDYTVQSVKYYNDNTEKWETLSSGTNYSVSGNAVTDLKRAGKYEITIQGTGKYTGELSTEVCCGTDISGLTAHIDNASELSFSYEKGSTKTPSAFSLYKNDKPVSGITYNAVADNSDFWIDYERTDGGIPVNEAAGKIYVVAVGNPARGYFGRTAVTDKKYSYYEIIAPIWTKEKLKITVATEGGITYQPEGGTRIPNVIVEFDGSPLTKDEDYVLRYDEAKLKTAGQQVIYVDGINNYEDQTNKGWPARYEVAQVDVASSDVVKTAKPTDYTNINQGEITLEHLNYTLVEGKDNDYTKSIKYVDGKAVEKVGDKYYVTYLIKGHGNYTGETEIKVSVNIVDLSEGQAHFAASAAEAEPGDFYVRWDQSELLIKDAKLPEKDRVAVTPSAFTIVYKMTSTDEVALKKDEDYEILANGYGSNNIAGNSASNYVTIQGIGGYTNTRQLQFTLFTQMKDATPTDTSLIKDGAVITKTEWQKAFDKAGEEGLLKLNPLSYGEIEYINPLEYKFDWTTGFDPADPDVGYYTVRVIGLQEAPHYYYGSITLTFTVVDGIEEAQVTIGRDNTVTYKGKENPVVVTAPGIGIKVVVDGNELVRDTDYVITDYSGNDSIGTATVFLKGIGKYSGTKQHDFKVTYPINSLVVFMKDPKTSGWVNCANETVEFDYTGNAIAPDIQLYCPLDQPDDGNYLDTEPLSPSMYGALDYVNNVDAGKGSVIIKDCPFFTDGSADPQRYVNFKIVEASICPPSEGGTVSYRSSLYGNVENIIAEYMGENYTAEDLGITLHDRTLDLEENRDYLVYYDGDTLNKSDPTALPMITFTGAGNYKGSEHKIHFTIVEKAISDTNITAEPVLLTYTDSALEQQIIDHMNVILKTPKGREEKLVCGTDADFVIEKYYTDAACNRPVSAATGVPNEAGTYYIPSAQGTYYVKINGINNFKGSRVVRIDIEKRDLSGDIKINFVPSDDSECTIDSFGEPDCMYDGKEHKPAIEVTYGINNVRLIEERDYTVAYTDNTNAGTEASVTVKMIEGSNYAGEATRYFTIKPKDITGADMSYRDSAGNAFQNEVVHEWTKNPVRPSVIVYDKSLNTTLTPSAAEGTTAGDYLVVYEDDNQDDNTQVNAGQVTMTIKGQGNYTGTKEFTYYIGEDISQSYTLVNGRNSVSVDYNGLVQAPDENDITVVWGAASDLTDANGEKRYDIAYYKDGFEKSNLVTRDQIVNAGTYYVAVIGVPSKGTYAKSSVNNSCTYTINPRSIAPSYILVSGYDGTYYYTGQQIQPKGIAVEDTDLPVSSDANDPQRRTVKLINGTDYDLSYSNNVAAGKASIIVTGKGNYTGNRVAYFNILSSNADGNNTWDGTSEGTGSISDGTTTISASDIILGYDNSAYNCMMYNGYERIPTVTINGISTNEFIITASNNIRPGVATLTITGRGNNFTGTIIKNYKIKANLATYGNIAAIADQVYTGYQITPHVTLTCGGNLLNQGSDYTVTYLNNTNVGKATVMANATSDSYYIVTATGSFNISNTAGGMEITGYGYSYTYTGYPIAPDIVVTMNGRVLNRGTDYTVTYSNNTNVGTATMTVNGIGSFSGTKTINYMIEAKNIENCLTTTVDNYQYTGSTYTPNVTVTDSSNGKTLVAGTDYTITYSNNTNPGTASITVTALSKNYTGSKVIPFKITSAAVSGLRTSTIKNNSIKLAWTAQDYAYGYQICNSNNRVVATTSKNSYTVKGLTSCTTYKFKVRSYVENADGSVSYGNFSTAVSAKTRLNTPTLKAKSTSKGKVTLTWTKVAKATGYEIYYSTKKDGIYTRLKTISKSSSRKYVDSGLASGEKYYYTIRAYRTSNGVKTYSNYNTIKSVKVK